MCSIGVSNITPDVNNLRVDSSWTHGRWNGRMWSRWGTGRRGKGSTVSCKPSLKSCSDKLEFKLGLNNLDLHRISTVTWQATCYWFVISIWLLTLLFVFHFKPTLNSGSRSVGSRADLSAESKRAAVSAVNDPSKSSQSRSMPSVGTGAGQIFSDIGLYKGVVVAIKHIKKEHIQVTRHVLMEFNEVTFMSLLTFPWPFLWT